MEHLETITIFPIKRSNIEFKYSKDGICTNKDIIKFDLDEYDNEGNDNLIPVNSETRDLICIGNKGKNKLKLQFTTIENEKYQIRTEPSLITIPPKYAIEFSIYIKPICTCTVEDNITIT